MYIWSGKVIYVLVRPFLALFMPNKERARAALIYENQILLVRNWIGHQKWSLPGGGVKKGESAEKALRRELEEELGSSYEKYALKKMFSAPAKLGSASFIAVVYSLEITEKKKIKVRKPEIIEAKWFSRDSLPENVTELTQKTFHYL